MVSISIQVPKGQHRVLRKPFIRSDSTDLFTDEFHYVQVAKYSVASPYLVITVKEALIIIATDRCKRLFMLSMGAGKLFPHGY